MSNFSCSYILTIKASKLLWIYKLNISNSSRELKFIKLSEFLNNQILTSNDQILMVESSEADIKRVLSGCSHREVTIRL